MSLPDRPLWITGEGFVGEGVLFPPRWQTALVPIAPRRAAALGTTLYTASRPLPWIAQNVLWALTRAFGSRALPGAHEAWALPVEPDAAAALAAEWRVLLGGEPDGVALYRRLQSSRAVVTLLLCAGERSLLVRVRRDADSLLRERAISEAAQGLRAVGVPGLAGAGEAHGWSWTAYRAITTRPHRPVYRLPDGAAAEIRTLVERVVARPPDTPTGWTGAHLDVSPWNLRRGARRTWLIDWEDAGWAPPGADEVYLAATVAAMGSRRLRPLRAVAAYPEAARYWHDVVAARDVTSTEVRLRERMLRALGT